MKRILLSLMAAGVVAAIAVPASAQGPRPSDGQTLAQRQDNIADRIADGEASGALTRLQAADLKDQFKGLLNLEDQYRQSGMSLHQREDLQARYDTLSARLNLDTDPTAVRPAAVEVHRQADDR